MANRGLTQETVDTTNLPEEARDGASCVDGVGRGFVSAYSVGRLERLTVFVRLSSEPEARSWAEGVPHSRQNPWQPQALVYSRRGRRTGLLVTPAFLRQAAVDFGAD